MERENPRDPADVDLFGNPIEPLRDRRGRPSFAKNKENQDFVANRVADGWSQKRIAEDIGCDEKTLRKYFSRELTNGALIIRGECLDILRKKAREGHVPSIRLLMSEIGSMAPDAPRRGIEVPDEDEDEQTLPLGKKEQRLRDAQDVPDDWGDIEDRRQTH